MKQTDESSPRRKCNFLFQVASACRLYQRKCHQETQFRISRSKASLSSCVLLHHMPPKWKITDWNYFCCTGLWVPRTQVVIPETTGLFLARQCCARYLFCDLLSTFCLLMFSCFVFDFKVQCCPHILGVPKAIQISQPGHHLGMARLICVKVAYKRVLMKMKQKNNTKLQGKLSFHILS